MNQNGIEYEEWKIEDEEVQHKLLDDPKFTDAFCDLQGCIVHTPVLHIDENDEYYYKELFNQAGVRASFIKKKLEIE